MRLLCVSKHVCPHPGFDRFPKTKIPSCARRPTLHATVAAAHPARLCAPSTPTTSPGRTNGEDRREQTEKRHTKAQARRPSATHRARHRRRRTPSMSVPSTGTETADHVAARNASTPTRTRGAPDLPRQWHHRQTPRTSPRRPGAPSDRTGSPSDSLARMIKIKQ